jgi:hypothetical protein
MRAETHVVRAFWGAFWAACLGFSMAFGQTDPAVPADGPLRSPPPTFQPPSPYDVETLYQQAREACPAGDIKCLMPQFQSITDKQGPRAAIELFTLLRSRGQVDPLVDGHHVAHHIGHETAMVFGPSAEALALCPLSYNYGCVHGFFQHALGMKELSEADAVQICADFPALNSKTRQSCYHGLGHGVMTLTDHDLHKALSFCDGLDSHFAQESCWQGVFMENVDAAIEGQWQKGLFSLDDPLAPCDQLDESHQYQCFINHSGWLMKFYKDDVAQASEACLKAAPASVAPCLETVGLLTTSTSWQPLLVPKPEHNEGFLDHAWALCQKFPESGVGDCVVGALDNLLNSGTADLKQAQDFCSLVGDGYREKCLRRRNGDLLYLTPKVKAESARPPAAPSIN